MKSASTEQQPWGLVMAGGYSRRMGADKASLVRPGGGTWLAHAVGLAQAVCPVVWVSGRPEQALELPDRVGLIEDAYFQLGPAAGLLSAWDRFPDRPWLVLATDMPWVSPGLLKRLVSAREPAGPATGFRHPDGVAEPLCTLWEPALRAPLQRAVAARKASLSAVLDAAAVKWLSLDDAQQLASANTPAERSRLEDA